MSTTKFLNSSKSELAADDLDDGLIYDIDGSVSAEVAIDSDDEYKDSYTSPQIVTNKKRKAQLNEDDESTSKKSKTKLKAKKQIQSVSLRDTKKSLALSTPSLIADHIASRVRSLNKNLSSLEVNDLLVPESRIFDTSDFVLERTDDNFASYIEFYLKEFLPVSSASKKKKTGGDSNTKNPKDEKVKKYILVLTTSAIRACDVTRALKNVPGSAIKLIKKNKLVYDSHALANGTSRVAVATVGRLEKLIANNMFDLEKQVAAIVVDSSWVDTKIQNTWDLQDTAGFVKRALVANSDTEKRGAVMVYLY